MSKPKKYRIAEVTHSDRTTVLVVEEYGFHYLLPWRTWEAVKWFGVASPQYREAALADARLYITDKLNKIEYPIRKVIEEH